MKYLEFSAKTSPQRPEVKVGTVSSIQRDNFALFRCSIVHLIHLGLTLASQLVDPRRRPQQSHDRSVGTRVSKLAGGDESKVWTARQPKANSEQREQEQKSHEKHVCGCRHSLVTTLISVAMIGIVVMLVRSTCGDGT